MCEVCNWITAHAVGGDDSLAVMALPSGTAVVATRTHARLATLAPAVQQRFLAMANESSIVLYESLQAHGTNIIIEDRDHGYALIVPRFENDELPYVWEGKRVAPKELQDVASKLGEATWTIGKKDTTDTTNPIIEEPKPTRISVETEAMPIKKPKKETELVDPSMQMPGSMEGTDLGDVAAEVQRTVKHGPTEERDYRIRQLTRRR